MERLDAELDPRAVMSEAARAVNLGAVVSIRGSVVDVRFDERLPPIYSSKRCR
jgi:hypothetical protein